MPQTNNPLELSLIKPVVGIATLMGVLLGTSLHSEARKILYSESQASEVTVAMLNEADAQMLVADVHQQINQYRASLNLSPLELNSEISRQAAIHSQNMAQGSAEFSHQGFQDRVKALAGVIPYRSAAENLGFNQGYQDPASVAVDGWIKSEGHQRNMVGDFNLTGIGIVRNGQGEYYFTQIFIKEQ